jgi:hypothetical protein
MRSAIRSIGGTRSQEIYSTGGDFYSGQNHPELQYLMAGRMMMAVTQTKPFAGKVALVTGGSKGIGAA